MEIPLFPLRTVLYPGGPLPLRIFEQRYLDMISRCMKSESPFGVLLIREGSETGPARTFDVGTLAQITDWYQGSDGLLGVTATGTDRFRRTSERRQDDGLLVGEIFKLIEVANGLPDAQVVVRKYIGPSQGEDEKHLGGPDPDAFDLNQLPNHLLIAAAS